MKPNRKQWASTMAYAALNYDQVMNEAIVTFDTKTGNFDWQSSLTPVSDSEIQIESDVRWEHYGDDKPTWDELRGYFANDTDEYWKTVEGIIANADEEDEESWVITAWAERRGKL